MCTAIHLYVTRFCTCYVPHKRNVWPCVCVCECECDTGCKGTACSTVHIQPHLADSTPPLSAGSLSSLLPACPRCLASTGTQGGSPKYQHTHHTHPEPLLFRSLFLHKRNKNRELLSAHVSIMCKVLFFCHSIPVQLKKKKTKHVRFWYQ